MGYERERTNETLIKHYLNTMRWMSATKEDREDLAQECRLKLWQVEQRDGVEPDGLDNALRYKICRDVMRDMTRRGLRETVGHEPFEIEIHDHAAPPSALGDLLAREVMDRIAQTDTEQGIALLHFEAGFDQDEVAKELNIATSTVNDAIRRMRQRKEDLDRE